MCACVFITKFLGAKARCLRFKPSEKFDGQNSEEATTGTVQNHLWREMRRFCDCFLCAGFNPDDVFDTNNAHLIVWPHCLIVAQATYSWILLYCREEFQIICIFCNYCFHRVPNFISECCIGNEEVIQLIDDVEQVWKQKPPSPTQLWQGDTTGRSLIRRLACYYFYSQLSTVVESYPRGWTRRWHHLPIFFATFSCSLSGVRMVCSHRPVLLLCFRARYS